jgi:glycosyltransferase involved in cell wall biosynthesis
VPDPLARRDLDRIIERWRPDVVHAHTWLGISAPRRAGVPIVLTTHDYALVCQLHTLFRTDGTPCDGPRPDACIRCGSRSYGWSRSALMASGTAVGRRLWRLDAIVTLSTFVAETMRRYTSVPVHTYGGMLAPVDPPIELLGLPTTPFALFAGDPGRHKGLDVLLAAWRDASPGMPLVVASTKTVDGPLPDGVTVVRLDRRQMASAWRRAALAVVPSVWPEPFGMVAMEALAAGTPVVASSVGALPEIVRDGIDGVLVPPGDPTALALAVRDLFADESRRRRMSAAAVEGAARFSAHAAVARLDEAYAQVLGKKLARR